MRGSPSSPRRQTLLEQVLVPDPPPFALLHRPHADPDHLEVLLGQITEVSRLADVPLPRTGAGPGRHEALAVVPYRQIIERGFACNDDHEPILVLTADRQAAVPLHEAVQRIPISPIVLDGAGFDIDDDTYADVVRRILVDEIGQGSGSNFVIKRSFTATIQQFSVRAALTLFRKLLTGEPGAYWTFVVHTGTRTFVGATPERHVSVNEGNVMMNPISGTYRYPETGPSLPEVIEFLADHKETDELYMVVDEELKMMARVCDAGGRVIGPFLKEMGQLAHTEYLLHGRTSLDVRDVLRGTMFAPTVTGSPLESACRVLARHEPYSRGYYSGVLTLIGRDGDGQRCLDSSILIRTAEINRSGQLRIGVGATLVRHSDPEDEVAETWAKVAGLLTAAGVVTGAETRETTNNGATASRRRDGSVGEHPDVRSALASRNATLARFWLADQRVELPVRPDLSGWRCLVIDAEDTFTAMLAHQLRALGVRVTIRRYDEWHSTGALGSFDVTIVGPGPGDPRDGEDPKIARMRRVTRLLLRRGHPVLSVCLGHQVLCSVLGLKLSRRDEPNQGVQREIDLFGRRELVGFYNTFAARYPVDRLERLGLDRPIELSRDPGDGEVHALRGPGFAGVQFHPESLLTRNGPAILAELLTSVVDRADAVRVLRSSG